MKYGHKCCRNPISLLIASFHYISKSASITRQTKKVGIDTRKSKQMGIDTRKCKLYYIEMGRNKGGGEMRALFAHTALTGSHLYHWQWQRGWGCIAIGNVAANASEDARHYSNSYNDHHDHGHHCEGAILQRHLQKQYKEANQIVIRKAIKPIYKFKSN